VAEQPEIVTPIGMTFDQRGRLLVIESHTHFRPENYEGPAADRIRVFEDTDEDGDLECSGTFFEGTVASMSLACHSDGTIFLATRNEVLRLEDRDGDGHADSKTRIAFLDTPGNYPHNGLSGLCFTRDGLLLFGLGENLGVDYKLSGSDGTTLSGGGEGGNVYQCLPDGSGLRKIATGFWNPFGICEDPLGRLFVVGNDPDGRPPCRLVQLVPGGDYGYQFRYGRTGKHPLQAWDGELPGTLPMMAGTGEAPSAVVPYDGALWVTSWGDHQIERYRLVEQGASWRATNDIVVVGDQNFRPVSLAIDPQGNLYFSDWVDRSYTLHRQGRIWRLSLKRELSETTDQRQEPREFAGNFPPLTEGELAAQHAHGQVDWDAAKSEDPFLWQAAVWGLVEHGAEELTHEHWKRLSDPRQRLAFAAAVRWNDPANEQWIDELFADRDPAVRLAAVRWVADQRWTKYRARVLAQLDQDGGTESLYRAAAAAVAWLDSGKPEPNQSLLVALGLDQQRPASLRAWALRLFEPDVPLNETQWRSLLDDPSQEVQREAIWALVLSDTPARDRLLQQTVRDTELSESLRADALVGLTREVEEHQEFIARWLEPQAPAALHRVAAHTQSSAGTSSEQTERPDVKNTDAWVAYLDADALREPDANAGRRVFFQSQAGRCFQCHRWNGQGADVGPDLTDVGRRMTRRRLVESILTPQREVAPQYKAFSIEIDDGRILTGMTLGQFGGGDQERFLDNQGETFDVDLNHVVTREMIENSIMPDGLVEQLTVDDLRDLLAFLGSDVAPEPPAR
jgi:putative membrane-bound dehydrogenase-like protein